MVLVVGFSAIIYALEPRRLSESECWLSGMHRFDVTVQGIATKVTSRLRVTMALLSRMGMSPSCVRLWRDNCKSGERVGGLDAKCPNEMPGTQKVIAQVAMSRRCLGPFGSQWCSLPELGADKSNNRRLGHPSGIRP